MKIYHLNEMNSRQLIPGFHVKFIHSENLTLADWYIEAGSALPMHSHQQEQLMQVVSGTFEFQLGDETTTLSAGMVVVIPSMEPHAGKALSNCRLVDVFYPVREEHR